MTANTNIYRSGNKSIAMRTGKALVFAFALLFAGILAAPYAHADELTPPALPNFLKPVPTDLIVSQATAEYKYIHVAVEKHRVGMEALIDYVDSTGGDTAKLTELKTQFISEDTSLQTDAQGATNYTIWVDEKKSTISKMNQTVSGFKTELATQIKTNRSQAVAALNSALAANKDYFSTLLTEARETHKDRNTKAFDYVNSEIQIWIDGSKANGTDVSAVQAKLDEIEDKRSDFIDDMDKAISSCQGVGILLGTPACNSAEVQAYNALRDEIISEYKELQNITKQMRSQKIGDTITKAYAIIDNADKTLTNAENNGQDVSAYRVQLDAVKAFVDSADAKYKAGDYTGATNDLKSAQAAFQALKQSAQNAKKG